MAPFSACNANICFGDEVNFTWKTGGNAECSPIALRFCWSSRSSLSAGCGSTQPWEGELPRRWLLPVHHGLKEASFSVLGCTGPAQSHSHPDGEHVVTQRSTLAFTCACCETSRNEEGNWEIPKKKKKKEFKSFQTVFVFPWFTETRVLVCRLWS